MCENNENIFGEVVYAYTLENAVEDGNIVVVPDVRKYTTSILTHMTAGIADEYIIDEEISTVNVIDLQRQVVNKYLKVYENPEGSDDDKYFFTVMLEFPSGQKKKVFVEWNGNGYTVMFPNER